MMATSLVHTIKMYEACLQCFIKSRKIMQKSVNCFDLLQQSRFMKNGPVLFDGSDAIDDVTNNMSHLTEWDQDNYGKVSNDVCNVQQEENSSVISLIICTVLVLCHEKSYQGTRR